MLRELTLEDAPAIRHIYSKRSVQHLPRAAMNAQDALDWVSEVAAQSRVIPRVRYSFGIDLGGDLIGIVTLRCCPGSDATVSYILRPDTWGHGHATKAVTMLLDYASDVLGLKTVSAKHHLDNPASGRVLIKAGFASTGTVGGLATYRARLTPNTNPLREREPISAR
ncbi:GNAT family N-acetyltransferase [Streptomyces sp. NBC_01381]|uniref:GNAT family N-acetyltransferase n=1 Tax=Streptomyces sp. NBC_01381 TaxID=2903845 RepID=UPI0022567FD5|nr:GNAT family N-acetyltransferase [Streptomyces sp. NBC_01381]MCX4666546.1 GNAT family N-acetyltransferase [Streptomyces sp. NBC_01381]